MSLKKIDLVSSIYDQLGISRKECVDVAESIFDIIKDDLDRGNSVNISGFGKWTVRSKKKRRGRNPQTGEEIMIDARRVITFKPSAVLRDAVNSGNR
jgi:integration host factor subunit alpha